MFVVDLYLDMHDYGYTQLSYQSKSADTYSYDKQNMNNVSYQEEYSNSKRKSRSIVDGKRGNINGQTEIASAEDAISVSSKASIASSFSNLPPPAPENACTRHELYVDFEKIGWSTWIISPKG